ncbi:hypothetical protein ES288_A11G086000v1 [Gossypium darwinii]|uniref:Uncharacterized protein n=2 Tax=Gossypium TaxID=3633 RepID=A0A5D2NB29_GOSTO|nr:hypothetical protein ES288_A11G086000v1 [Gossypium darwinii]TYH99729.1 hypothetical protein ES332_A11G086000v1 [Gossypium tomentosum]
MKSFRSFKDKFRSQGQRSDPELKGERKAEGCSGPDRISKSSSAGSAASPHNTPELYEAKSHNLRSSLFQSLGKPLVISICYIRLAKAASGASTKVQSSLLMSLSRLLLKSFTLMICSYVLWFLC